MALNCAFHLIRHSLRSCHLPLKGKAFCFVLSCRFSAYKLRVMHMKNRDDIIAYTAQPRIEIIGNSEFVVDGLKSVLEYTKEKIKIDLGKYSVAFYGDALYINAFTHEGAVVQGTVVTMEFCSNG